jgi:CheY-like chemotaxis protein
LQAQRTLLLADDSPTTRKVVSLTFGDEGMRVVAVGGGAEALAELDGLVPDVVLADVHMPAPDGYELCARIKQDARLRHVPVMLLVGKYELFDEAEARKCGADEVLTKPFQSIRELVSKVSGMLGGQPAEKRAEEDARAETAARPRAESPAAPSPEEARADFAPPPAESHAFAGFDFDDENIESATAEEFSAREQSRAAASAAGEFSERAADDFAESAAPSGLSLDAASLPQESPGWAHEAADAAREASAQQQHASAQPHEARGYAAAASASGVAGAHAASPAGFTARAPQSADDSLLDLEELDASAPPEDDFVLDIDDEPAPAAWRAQSADPARASAAPEARGFDAGAGFAEAARAETPLAADDWPAAGDSRAGEATHAAETAHAAEAQTFGESHAVEPSFAAGESQADGEALGAHEISPANLSNAWNEAEQFNVSPQADTEPVAEPPGTAPVLEAAEEAFAAPRAGLDSGAELGDAAESAPQAWHEAAPSETGAAGVAHEVAFAGESEVSAGESPQAGASQLSQEMIDAIARRVVEQLSESVVREIAWDVVPELAERLIRQRLDEQK